MEEEKLRELISVQELLDDEDDEAFNVCTKGGKKYNDITLVQKNKSFNLYILYIYILYIHVHDLANSLRYVHVGVHVHIFCIQLMIYLVLCTQVTFHSIYECILCREPCHHYHMKQQRVCKLRSQSSLCQYKEWKPKSKELIFLLMKR